MTQSKIRSIFEMCWQDGRNPNYRESADILNTYMLQAANCLDEDFIKIEGEIIKNKEDQTMKSTYDRLIDKGIEKGIEKGREEGIEKGREGVILNMLKKKMDISTIVECTGVSKEQVVQLQKSLS